MLAVTPRTPNTQNVIAPQCDHCPKIPTGPHKRDHTPVPYTYHTTQGPSTAPSPSEYIVNSTSGVCLRIKANIMVTLNFTKRRRNITIPPPPITEIYGYCYNNRARLSLHFPRGRLTLRFIQNNMNSLFYLEKIYVYMHSKGVVYTKSILSLKAWVTPLGHSFTCDEVIFRMTPNVTLILRDVMVQAFQLEGYNSDGDFGTKSDSCDNESAMIIYESHRSTDSIFSLPIRHWSVTRLVPTIHTLVFLVSLPLNIMAIIMFLVKMKVRKPAVVYMLNLAAADLLLISILPFYIIYRFSGSNWLIGEGMCRFVTAASYCNMYCSILLMTSISVDRFLAVVYPVRSLPWRTLNRAWVVCGIIWVISFASVVPFLKQMQSITFFEHSVTMCHDFYLLRIYSYFHFAYFTSVISLFFFLPLFITTFCYVGIIHRLSRSKFDRKHKRWRAIVLAIIVLCVFALCFGPTNVIYLMYHVRKSQRYDFSLYAPYTISSSISSINCCLDPLIYYFASSQCQRYVYSLMRGNKDYRPPVKQKMTPKHKDQSQEETYSVYFSKSK
ncbi:proteinase-activated receptor 1-like isoform X2 [Pyxicephalus adspersus]